MRKLNILLLNVLVLGLAMTSLTSCGDDEPCTDTALDFEGTWVGRFIVGLIPINNYDTLIITANGNNVNITSQLLGGATFEAEYDPITGNLLMDSIAFENFVFETDTFYDISVRNGKASISNNCDEMFLELLGVSVNSGTINLPAGMTYPLQGIELDTDRRYPFKKQ